MPDILLLIFELIGTVSFALSGALTALKKQMDIFGVVILGLTTAVGGGIIRDIILGNTPPATFQSPIYAAVAVITAVIVFFPAVRHTMGKKQQVFEITNLIMDSVGLGVFTVVGIQKAYEVSREYSVFLLVFVGIVTGVGGGVMRDVLSGNTPYIFVKHFYATASLIGAVVCVLFWKPMGTVIAMLSGAVLIIVLRLFAARFHWSLPHSKE